MVIERDAKLEICVHNGWLMENCGFQCCDYEDQADAAEEYRARLADQLQAVGFAVVEPTGTVRTYHGWENADRFWWRAGAVATGNPITRQERELVWTIMDEAACAVANQFGADMDVATGGYE